MGQTTGRGIQRRLEIVITDSLRQRMRKYTSDIENSNGCLIWTGAQRNGYGAIKSNGTLYQSHCVAFVIAGGVIVPGGVIAHRCDVKACVNPSHLECVSVQKNNMDAHARLPRNHLRGEQCVNSVLTDQKVREIRKLYVYGKVGYGRVASQLGIARHLAESVITGQAWQHVV